jgi:hypothetical protein
VAFASIDGHAPIRSDPDGFTGAFLRRVEEGLLSGRPHPRSRYTVTRADRGRFSFRASDWKTAVAVGLNEVDVSVTPGRARFQIRYPRWAAFVLGLCGTFGAAFILFLLLFDLRGYLERHPDPAMMGMSPGQGVAFAWAMGLFWGFLWPWLLIGLHRRPVRQLMERLIADVDGRTQSPAVRASR